MSKRRYTIRWISTGLAAAIVLLGGSIVSAQSVRGTANRPSARVSGGGFYGSLGTNSFSNFRSQSRSSSGYSGQTTYSGSTALNPAQPVRLSNSAMSLRPGSSGQSAGLSGSQSQARMNYGRNQLSVGGGWQPFVGRDELSTLANAPTMDWTARVPLLGGSNAMSIEGITGSMTREDYEECVAAGHVAYAPFHGELLQRPNLSLQATASLASLQIADAADNENSGYLEEGNAYRGTFQSSVFNARQLAEARDHLRAGRYEGALLCYQSAIRLDPACVNGMIGAAYCHIMLGRFQAGSYMVLRVAAADPGFFHAEVNFDAAFGMSKDNALGRLEDVRPQVAKFIETYAQSPSQTERIRTVSMGYLIEAYLAWLHDDDAAFVAAVQQACQASPFSEPVQRLGRAVTGREAQAERPLAGVKPIQ